MIQTLVERDYGSAAMVKFRHSSQHDHGSYCAQRDLSSNRNLQYEGEDRRRSRIRGACGAQRHPTRMVRAYISEIMRSPNSQILSFPARLQAFARWIARNNVWCSKVKPHGLAATQSVSAKNMASGPKPPRRMSQLDCRFTADGYADRQRTHDPPRTKSAETGRRFQQFKFPLRTGTSQAKREPSGTAGAVPEGSFSYDLCVSKYHSCAEDPVYHRSTRFTTIQIDILPLECKVLLIDIKISGLRIKQCLSNPRRSLYMNSR